jgi:hypothetical protein
MEALYPIDHRSIPPTVEALGDLAPDATEARIIGPPKDLATLPPSFKLERLWLQNMRREVAARLAPLFDPVQLSLTNIQTADLGWLGELPRLRDLLIDWNTKLESFNFLRHVAPLSRLRGDGLKRTHRLDGLVHQPSLRSLWLGGGIDRRLEVATLEPLSRLVNLEHLFLICMRLDEPSLAPLAGLRKLKRLRIQTNMAPMEEYARLAGALPDTESDSLRGFKTLRRTLPFDVDLLDVIDDLDGEEQVIMVGKGGRRFKVGTHRDQIVEQLLRFRRIRDAEQARLQASRHS